MRLARSQLLLAVGLIPCVAVSLAALYVVPRLDSTFAAVGMVGPWRSFPTHVLMATYQWWGVVALATAMLWLVWPVAANRGRVAATFGIVSSAALLLLGVVGGYAPLFLLAAGR